LLVIKYSNFHLLKKHVTKNMSVNTCNWNTVIRFPALVIGISWCILYLRRSVSVVIKTGVKDFVLVKFMTNDSVVDCPFSFADDFLGRRWTTNNCSELPKYFLSALFIDAINFRDYTALVVDE